ncbi:MAG: DNA repair protein RadA [bacterium]|nr:DNA repair protein RadA [bacterium]
MTISRKVRTAYFCGDCGAEHPRWQGQCRECGEWNKLIEEKVPTRKVTASAMRSTQCRIPDIQSEKLQGYQSGIGELDRVLGGQLLPGMTVLIGGDPGIGKSTLILQAAEAYSQKGLNVLYVTGEESLPQIKLRANRLNVTGSAVTAMNSTSVEEVTSALASGDFSVVLIDSIQTMASSALDSPPGTVGQVRESAAQLIMQAKAAGHALFLIGHVTKDGMVAGPKVLEHMVDTVIYFEGDTSHLYRMLRAAKNRFGSVAEIGVFEMKPEGLVEVSNPSSFFLSDKDKSSRTGSVVAAVCEGNRPFLVEIQALVTSANYGTAQRVAGGIDNKRLALLLAILEKRCGYPMAGNDVFVSVAGGVRLSEPALDLPIMAAIVSSFANKAISSDTVAAGEVGLSGEVRGISMADRRINEAEKMGFKRIILPQSGVVNLSKNKIKLHGASDIEAALELLLQ